jgi:hypothetical protein
MSPYSISASALGTKLEASQRSHGFTANQQNASFRAVPRAHSGVSESVVVFEVGIIVSYTLDLRVIPK